MKSSFSSASEGVIKSAKKYIKNKKVLTIKPKIQLKVITKKGGELRKHQMNLKTIMQCSNATPIKKHNGVGYMCCFCVRDFPEPSLLKNHTRQSHDETALPSFTANQTMQGFVIKLDITDLHCTLCETPFTTLEDFTNHLTATHNKTYNTDIKSHIIPFRFSSDAFRCVNCATRFSNFKVLHEHMNEHFRNHICEVCGKGYVNLVQFQTHMYRHNKGVFECSICSKVFDTRVKWRAHERATHVLMNKRSKCGYCGERFNDYGKKQSHVAEKHGVKHVLLQCRACDKSFNNQRALTVHNKAHHLMDRKVSKCD